jgi:UDPglucose 6-dehydrogenase
MGNIQGKLSMKIGIIGYGFVGRAVAAAYEEDQLLINDPLYKDSISIKDMKEKADSIFVCVPTPQGDTGECDTRILIDVLSQLTDYTGLVISKSTATPQIYSDLEKKYSDMKFCHVPEFLTAANAVVDYQYPVNIVVGARRELRQEIFSTIITNKINFDFTKVKFCSVAEAAMFKYVANTMLAMKVVINNEYYDLCNSLGISWDNVAAVAQSDPRLGDTHWQVPGPDGSRGFGGACFPKDIQAILSLAKFLNVDMSMLKQAIERNGRLRN